VAEAGPQSVTEVVGDQPGLAVDDLNGAFGAAGNAFAAAVALVFVDFYDFSDHGFHSSMSGYPFFCHRYDANLTDFPSSLLDRDQAFAGFRKNNASSSSC
jgi:hypothetical protein